MTDNKTERYMIIFNDLSLAIKGYYNELITPIHRKKILDRLYSLIHRELFEGLEPLKEVSEIQSASQATQTMIEPQPPKKKYYYYKKKGTKKGRPRKIPLQPPSPPPSPLSDESKQASNETQSQGSSNIEDTKDSLYDDESDNQYEQFKKKGLI